uniref:Uncharacterized protein n=1 Tax=Anguilla anguilla TaxID=7936 RepID=A0A0E9SS67_ANGAN
MTTESMAGPWDQLGQCYALTYTFLNIINNIDC